MQRLTALEQIALRENVYLSYAVPTEQGLSLVPIFCERGGEERNSCDARILNHCKVFGVRKPITVMEITDLDKLIGLIEQAVKFDCPTINQENAVITQFVRFFDVDRVPGVLSGILENDAPHA